MANDETNGVLEPSSGTDPRADHAVGLPAAYVRHLQDRRDRFAEDTAPPAFDVMLVEARGRAESGRGSVDDLATRRGRRPVTMLSAAAVVALLLVGIAVVLGQRSSSVTVEMAGPGDTAPSASSVQGDQTRSVAGLAAPGLDGVPLLFPPGPADQMQAQIGVDPEIEEPEWVIDGGLETFIAGTVDQPAKLISVVSVPVPETGKLFGFLNVPPEFGDVRNADAGFSAEVLRSAIQSAFGPVDTSVQISEMDLPGLAIEGRLFDVRMQRYVELPIDSRLVVIPTETATTVVMASNVDRETVESVVENLVVERGLLRAGVLPGGFDRLFGRSDERTTPIRVLTEKYVVTAPPSMGPNADPPNDGPQFPSRLSVYSLDGAAGMVALWASQFVVSAESVVLREGPDWVLGTLDPAVAFGVRDGVWMSVGDYTIRAVNQAEPGDWRARMMDGLRDLWAGVHIVDGDLFERAVRNGDDAADRRAARATATTTTTTATTTTVQAPSAIEGPAAGD